MILTKPWGAIKSLFKPEVTTVTTTTNDETAESPVVVTTQTTPAEIADTDLTNAITIVNNIKAALASPLAVLITTLIPGTVDDKIREDLVNDLPALTAGLANIKSYVDTSDKSAQFNDVLSQIRLSPNMDMDAFEHALAARILQKLSGTGWSIAVMAVEYFFVNEFKGLVSGIKSLVQDVTGSKPVAEPVAATASTTN